MKKLNQSGFSAVEGLLVLILLAILGFTGFYVFYAQRSANKTLDAAAKTAKASTPTITKSSKTAVAKQSSNSTTPVTSTPTSSEVKTVKYADLPSDLHAAVATYIKQAHPGCINSSDQLLTEAGTVSEGAGQKYVAGNAAFIAACQSVELYAYSANQWKFLGQTQLGFDCTLLDQYSVSPALLVGEGNGKCLDASGNFVSYH